MRAEIVEPELLRQLQRLAADLARILEAIGQHLVAGSSHSPAKYRFGTAAASLGFAVIDLPYQAWVAVTLGRASDLVEVIESEPFKSPWLRASVAAASRDFRTAADLFEGMGIFSHEAFFRLRAAEQFVDEGRRAEADEQLRRALAFYRSVGATRYVREGEALLAASA